MALKAKEKHTLCSKLEDQKGAKRAMQEYGLQEAEVRIKGAGAGRESALRAIHAAGIKIKAIRDVTPIPTMDADHLQRGGFEAWVGI